MKFTAQELIAKASYSLSDMGHDEGFSLAQVDAIINAFDSLSNKSDNEQEDVTDRLKDQKR